MQVNVNEIYSDMLDFNCRHQIITPFEVETLADSIKEKGLLQPILVQPYDRGKFKYKIIVGHRRFAAIKRLKHETIDCKLVSNVTESDARSMNLIENLERENLNMLQEAKAIEWFLNHGMTLKEIAKKVNKSTGWVHIRASILNLDEDIQKEIAAGWLKQDQIRALHDIPSRQGKIEAVKKIKEAKERGESVDIIETYNKKKTRSITDNLDSKVVRTAREIFEVQDAVTDQVGPNIVTRTLAWTGGVISTKEYLEDLNKEYPSFIGVKND